MVGIELFIRLRNILPKQNGKADKHGKHEHPLDIHASRFDPAIHKQDYCADMNADAVILAGAVGIEPTNDGTKTRCLTTWLRPTVYDHQRPRISIAKQRPKVYKLLQ